MTTLKTAEQAVLNAVGQLGHGNVHQLAEESGYARSTVDKAIKALSNAGLITAYDTGADPAEGTPTQWQLAEDDASAPIGAEPDDITDHTESTADEHTEISDDEDDSDHEDDHDEDDYEEDDEEDEEDEDDDSTGGQAEPARPAVNQRVLGIAGAMVAHPGGLTLLQLNKITNYSESALNRLLAAMVSGGAAVLLPGNDGEPARWKNGATDPADINPHPVTPRCQVCQRKLPDGFTPDAAAARTDEESKVPDRNVLTLAGTMYPRTAGAGAAELAKVSRIAPGTVLEVLTAMERAGVVARSTETGADGEPLWMLNPGQPLENVDLNPKCSGCHRPMPGSRSSRSTPTGTRRADALPRNVLRDATLAFILARPGIVLSPGKIAAALAIELNRDAVSPGAVKNNCEGFAAEGKILQVSSTPWLFSTLPVGETAASSDGMPPAGDNSDTAPDSGEQDTAA